MPTKKRAGRCTTPRCVRPASKRTGKSGLCETCKSRAWREANPMRHAFNNLKAHAKERGKEFDLSFAEFEAFALRVGYMDKKGRGRDSFHIDRRDETRGYTFDNLQAITNEENTRKFVEYKRGFIRDLHGKKWMTKAQAGL